MYCAHCGKEVPDDTVFCSFCGKKTAEEESFGSAEGEKKGKIFRLGAVKVPKVKGRRWIPLIAVILVLIVLIPSAPYIFNGLKKLTTSPEKYCQYVLKKNFVDTKAVSGMYDRLIYQRLEDRDNIGFSGETSLKLSEDAQEMLEDGLRIDGIEAFSDLKFSYDIQKKANLVSCQIKCNSGKKDILTGNII